MTRNLPKRAERLRRLAYELEALGQDAERDGLGDAGRGLKAAASSCRAASNAYFEASRK